jgi:hypothetical protein
MKSAVLIAALLFATVNFASANPLEALRRAATGDAGGDTLQRLPNDNVEGTVWEYKGVLEKGKAAADEKAEDGDEPKLSGHFRTEGEAIFAVTTGLKLPSRKEVKKIVDSVREGQPQEVPLPNAEPKRIGEYKLSRSGKLALDFNDEEGLFGKLVLRRKKGTDSVWIGDFQEKEGKRTVRTWQMEVRSVKD